MIKKCILFTGLIFVCFSAFTQSTGYEISIGLEGYPDTSVYLGNYFGDKLSVADTSFAKDGKVVFSGKDPLGQGVYFVASIDRKKLFEFMIDSDQFFILETSLNDPIQQMKIEGSDENEIFYNYLKNNSKIYQELKSLQSVATHQQLDADSTAMIQEKIDSLNDASIAYKLNLMEDYPESMTALLFILMKDPDIPDFFTEYGRQDTLSAYLYYRHHYWDGIDFSDERLIRTPVFHRKLEKYMTDVIQKHPDSVVMEIDDMLINTGQNTEIKDYLLWYFTNTYEVSNIMGYDKVFVHMVDEYFTDQTYDWLHPTVQQNMINRVNKIRSLLLGEYAPTLLMADTSEKFVSLHQIEAEYLIILFWSSTCGECQREVKILNELYNNSDIDLKVYAVNSDTSFTAWKEYVQKHDLSWINVNGNLSLSGDYHDAYDIFSTPVIYILDDEKKIIAKRISAANIPDFLLRFNKSKK